MSVIKPNNALTIVAGNNFSGRSKYLQSIIKQEGGIFIGEQPSSSITGIFPTVKGEINLHSNSANLETIHYVNSLFEQYDFHKNYDKNPFILSGGEQAILALLSAFLLQPQKIAIDCTLEQLNKTWREPLLKAVQQGTFRKTETLLADNRISEYGLTKTSKIVPNNNYKDHQYKFEKPRILDILDSLVDATTIDILDLNFHYNRKQLIFKNLKARLLPNEIYHLIGDNGVGKSTFAKILAGVLKPQSGIILQNNNVYNSYKFPGQLVGYSFQNPDEQLFSTTVENEVLPFQKKETASYTERRNLFINMFGLQNIRKEHPAEMPFTIRKRIALAATLAIDRAWYILDEPTLAQDNNFADFLSKLLCRLKKQGKGIIIISHSEYLGHIIDAKKISLSENKHNQLNML